MGAGEVLQLHPAVAAVVRGGEAQGRRVLDDRHVDRALDLVVVEAAVARLDVARVVALRLLVEDADRASDRVAAVEGALRPALDLHAVDVEQLEHRAERRRVVHVVDIEPDLGLKREAEIELADAADERLIGLAEAVAALGHGDVGRGLRDIDHVGDAALLDLVRVHGGDRHRDLLQRLRAELRGDHDLADLALVGRAGILGRIGLRRGVAGLALVLGSGILRGRGCAPGNAQSQRRDTA